MKDNVEQPIAFISKALNTTEVKWSTPEKECYAIFFALVKLEYLLRDIHFTLRTDHRNLTFLNESFQKNVKRWKLAIMHFNFNIEHIPGVNNVVADALSRLVKVPQHYLSESSFDEEESDEMLYIISEGALNEIPYFRPEDDIYKRLTRVHNSTVGHVGVEKMISRLKNMKTSWRKMRMNCKKFINVLLVKKCPH